MGKLHQLKRLITKIRYALWLHSNPEPKCAYSKPIGVGEFRVIQNLQTYSKSSGYISLIIHDKKVVAQKLVCDNDTYDEIFNFIVSKLGGRIPEEKDELWKLL